MELVLSNYPFPHYFLSYKCTRVNRTVLFKWFMFLLLLQFTSFKLSDGIGSLDSIVVIINLFYSNTRRTKLHKSSTLPSKIHS